MAAPLTQTLVVQEHDEADETGLSIRACQIVCVWDLFFVF